MPLSKRARLAGLAKPATLAKPASFASGSRNSVRIIGGTWRGRRITFPEIPGLRPTPDRVRETLFNWLPHSLAGARCLDLFAGCGALGLEALSRGAKSVVFVEQAQAAARGLQAELERLGGRLKGRVMEMGAARFLRSPTESVGGPFDILFLDPPFRSNALAQFIPAVYAGGWVRPAGWVYLEHERDGVVPQLPACWELLKSKSAGEVGYHLVRVKAQV